MKKYLFITLSFGLLISIFSCDQLEEQDTPLCKDCHSVIYKKNTDSIISYEDTLRLCGGDVVTWENMNDIETDSTTEKHFCLKNN